MKLRAPSRDWRTKAVVQKAISILPRSSAINYLFQSIVTGTATRTDDWRQLNMAQAARHMANWQDFGSTSLPPDHVLELGTGWQVTVPICLALWGADRVTTVDRTSLLHPRRLAEGLRLLDRLLDSSDSLRPSDPGRASILRELARAPSVDPAELRRLGVHVCVGDLRELSSQSVRVDLFVSNNVLEHITTTDLPTIFATYRELASDNALMSHFIDLADHFSAFDPTISSRNFLRYTDRQWRRWNNELVPQNRLLLPDYRKAHYQAGFAVCAEEVTRAPEADLSRFILAPEFGHYSVEELLVETAWLVSQVS